MSDPTNQSVETWLASYIAGQLGVEASTIPLGEHFVNLGLSSREAISMIVDLETFIGRPIDPGLAWEYPTIRELAAHLVEGPK